MGNVSLCYSICSMHLDKQSSWFLRRGITPVTHGRGAALADVPDGLCVSSLSTCAEKE